MLQNKDIETLRMLFSSHNYVMTTAELTASKLYYADIKQLLDEGLIEDLPNWIAVEVSAKINKNGINGIKLNNVPKGYLAILRNYTGVYDCSILL